MLYQELALRVLHVARHYERRPEHARVERRASPAAAAIALEEPKTQIVVCRQRR